MHRFVVGIFGTRMPLDLEKNSTETSFRPSRCAARVTMNIGRSCRSVLMISVYEICRCIGGLGLIANYSLTLFSRSSWKDMSSGCYWYYLPAWPDSEPLMREEENRWKLASSAGRRLDQPMAIPKHQPPIPKRFVADWSSAE